MSAMLSVTQLEAGQEVFHKYLKPTPGMTLPPLSVCIEADMCLNYEIHTPTGALKTLEDCTISNASPRGMPKRWI